VADVKEPGEHYDLGIHRMIPPDKMSEIMGPLCQHWRQPVAVVTSGSPSEKN
jgi:hypothetical protein